MAGKATDVGWLAGVDACPGGWLVAFARPEGSEIHRRVEPHFKEVLAAPESPRIIVVDIPIGLPDFSELQGREPERLVRPLLGPRRSSIFRVPSRSAVYAGASPTVPDAKERFVSACIIARATSVDRKAFSKQGFCLFPKIVQVDQLLTSQKHFVDRVFESHPELAFRQLNDGKALIDSKKSEAGLDVRRRLLLRAKLPIEVVAEPPPKGATHDDLLDALACAVVARRINQCSACRFPAVPKRDSLGLTMAIYA
jgi:predicted RNase H-like nuclease